MKTIGFINNWALNTLPTHPGLLKLHQLQVFRCVWSLDGWAGPQQCTAEADGAACQLRSTHLGLLKVLKLLAPTPGSAMDTLRFRLRERDRLSAWGGGGDTQQGCDVPRKSRTRFVATDCLGFKTG